MALYASHACSLLLIALEAGNGDLHGKCRKAKHADFPAVLQAVMLGYLPGDDDTEEDGDRQDQFVHGKNH